MIPVQEYPKPAVQTKIESESESDVNLDGDFSDSTGCSSEKVIRNVKSIVNRSKSKPTTDESISKKREKVPMTTKNKIENKPLNQNPPTIKPAQPKVRPIKCSICKQKFPPDALMSHLQSRHVPRIDPVPTCETCGKTFSTPGNLRSHQHLHAERGRYICSYCGNNFFRNANLKEHINLHTGARPFHCDFENCNKTFHRETLLRNHKRIHTGEKKYRCNFETCDRAYMFDIDLKRHKFSAHGIYSKKHPCFICSKIFSENKLLKKHLETH